MVTGTERPQVRVLMVDDDLVDRRAVRRALGEGYVVTEAEDGSQARRSFDSAVPDCVLLDYNIPGTNTLDLLDRFRQRAPVVMLTGQDDVEAAVAAMKAGRRIICARTSSRPNGSTRRSTVRSTRPNGNGANSMHAIACGASTAPKSAADANSRRRCKSPAISSRT